jgi:hypothetical protein
LIGNFIIREMFAKLYMAEYSRLQDIVYKFTESISKNDRKVQVATAYLEKFKVPK